MRAVEITVPGGPEVLVPGTRPRPVPGPGEVLLRVAAAGVNRPDCFQRAGAYPPPPGASDIPGLEVAGTVVALGGGDSAGITEGDRVCALVAGGGYAEFCTAPAPQCLPVPRGLSLAEAAALPETFFTVWSNVFDRGHLQAGETLLVHGGASGIGTTAIQLARAFGAEVIVTVGSADKQQACLDLGARRAINYRQEDFVAVVNEMTAGRGVDLILDMVGGDYVARNVGILAPDGRLVQIAFLGAARRGSPVSFDYAPVMHKRLTLTGSTLRPRPIEFKAAIARALRERVWPLIEAGRVRPVIHRTLALEQAAEAHRLLESNTVIGKLVLVVGDGT
ncbi:MAG: NAD(P)H-quinone oxidoreductase [Gammaproteobacteria bacterium]|nr:NAD(P)H-quinone oxidoreductase [Gammaproteobacteria bacterium]